MIIDGPIVQQNQPVTIKSWTSRCDVNRK